MFVNRTNMRILPQLAYFSHCLFLLEFGRHLYGFCGGIALVRGPLSDPSGVDQLSKYNHFTSLSHPYTAAKIAQLFISNVFMLMLHGVPNSIVYDQDPTFTSAF